MAEENSKLPSYFKSVLWSYKFPEIAPDEHKRTIVINTINHGMWNHWQWIFNYYGKENLREFIKDVPKSEFRKSAIKLFCLLLNISLDDLKYETRSAYIRSQRNTASV